MANDDHQSAVKLHGSWPSPFSCRVKWALDLKGIPYENIEEDLPNNKKSKALLQYNPIHKKVPVLVHDGKPLCESMIIIEYLDHKWPHKYPLLPNDPYERALARFWVQFAEDKGPSIWTVFRTTGEEQEKAKRDSLAMLRTIEEEAIKIGDKKFFGGDQIGIVDIAFGSIAHWFGVIEEIVGIKLFDAKEFPNLNAWAKNLIQVPVIKQNLPDRGELLAFFKCLREKLVRCS